MTHSVPLSFHSSSPSHISAVFSLPLFLPFPLDDSTRPSFWHPSLLFCPFHVSDLPSFPFLFLFLRTRLSVRGFFHGRGRKKGGMKRQLELQLKWWEKMTGRNLPHTQREGEKRGKEKREKKADCKGIMTQAL